MSILPTPTPLSHLLHPTEDQAAVVLRACSRMQLALHTLARPIQAGEGVSAEFASTVLKLGEQYTSEIGKTLGIATESEAELEARFSALREANTRINELENQLGDSQAPELVQAGLKRLHEQLSSWWAHEGLGLISSCTFDAYGAEVQFSCSLYGQFSLLDSMSPASDLETKAEWIKSLKAQGFILFEGKRTPELLDTAENRKLICRLFADRLPSSKVFKFESYSPRGREDFVLQSATVRIHRLGEVSALDATPSR